MEFSKVEVKEIETTVNEVRELADLELALVGGGCGDVALA